MTITHAPTPVDARIAAAAVPGFPLVSRRALRDVGVARASILRRIADERLSVLWPGMLVVGRRPQDPPRDLVLMAAVAFAGPHAVLDGASALERHDLWDRHDGTVHVASPEMHRPIHEFRITFHRRVGREGRRPVLVQGIPTRDATDALFAAAGSLTRFQLAYIIKRGEYRHAFTLDSLEDECRRRRHHPHVDRVRAAIRLRRMGSAGTKSRSEDRPLPAIIARHGEPLVNVCGAAGLIDYEPDFCWPESRVIVEIDGGHHRDDVDQREKDEARDRLLREAGWTIVRIWWRDVWQDLSGVLDKVARAFSDSTLAREGPSAPTSRQRRSRP